MICIVFILLKQFAAKDYLVSKEIYKSKIMDRLVIENVLSDVNEIFLSKELLNPGINPSIVMGFKPTNTEQVIHAFAELKKLIADDGADLLICRTMQSGIYDLEICTSALDEPIRIMNKSITNETLGQIEDHINKSELIALRTNVSEGDNWIDITHLSIKACE